MPTMLKVRQLAERLNVCPALARKLIAEGHIKAIRVGGTIRVPESEVERYIRSYTEEIAA